MFAHATAHRPRAGPGHAPARRLRMKASPDPGHASAVAPRTRLGPTSPTASCARSRSWRVGWLACLGASQAPGGSASPWASLGPPGLVGLTRWVPTRCYRPWRSARSC